MSATTFEPIPARPAPVKTEGAVAWIRSNLFGSWQTTIGTLIMGAILLYILPPLFGWALIDAKWAANSEACHADRAGAASCCSRKARGRRDHVYVHGAGTDLAVGRAWVFEICVCPSVFDP